MKTFFQRLPVIIIAVYLAVIGQLAAAETPLERGRKVYDFYCYQCHGYAGDAKTLASTYLEPRPRNFTAVEPGTLDRESMLRTLREGRTGTAMVSFARVLDDSDMEAVIDYIRLTLMQAGSGSPRYHSSENGWPNHERYRIAFPFVSGELTLEIPWDRLDEYQRSGRRLYMEACVTCHDHGAASSSLPIWEPRAVSYPRRHYSHRQDRPDALSGATIFSSHEQPVSADGLDEKEKRGRQAFLDNCAFCHAPDGSSRNWIGSFLEPRPRDLTADNFVANASEDQLRAVILRGIPGTSMPAWQHVLTTSQVEEIIAFLKTAFGEN